VPEGVFTIEAMLFLAVTVKTPGVYLILYLLHFFSAPQS
jgi:hypothetical protein